MFIANVVSSPRIVKIMVEKEDGKKVMVRKQFLDIIVRNLLKYHKIEEMCKFKVTTYTAHVSKQKLKIMITFEGKHNGKESWDYIDFVKYAKRVWPQDHDMVLQPIRDMFDGFTYQEQMCDT